MKDFIKKRLNEELTKSDIKDEIDNAMKSTALKDIISKIVKDKLKNDPELERHMVNINKNVLTQLYKTLWTKRSFWSSALTNKPA
jgi:hypothetical protein